MHPRTLMIVVLPMLSACSLHSVATHWNGRVGPDGHPVFVRTVTNIGVNVGVVLPLLGKTTLDEMVREATDPIAEHGSDHIRVIETSSENYWYGFPPLTWIVTPVITTVGVEYRPSAAEIAAVEAAEEELEARARERREQDNTHVIPEPRR